MWTNYILLQVIYTWMVCYTPEHYHIFAVAFLKSILIVMHGLLCANLPKCISHNPLVTFEIAVFIASYVSFLSYTGP